MKLKEAKQKYIHTWGVLATKWGISRTMAQVHALLLVSVEPLSTEDIMDTLQISRGNTNMNIRSLIDWGIVEKKFKVGERKEFFVAGKDIWELFKIIIKEREKREILPVINSFNELKNIKENTKEAKEFKKVITDLHAVTYKVHNIVDKIIKSDEHWLLKNITQLLK